jgi:hypothetical protein
MLQKVNNDQDEKSDSEHESIIQDHPVLIEESSSPTINPKSKKLGYYSF